MLSKILSRSAFFLGSCSALLLAQTPAIATKTLMQEPLGDTVDPKVSVFILPIPGGLTAGAHTHKGPVFAYILEGDIENQVDPDPPKLYHPGDFFHEPTMHVHRMLLNLSGTESAKLVIFEVGDTGKANPAIKTLLEEPADVANREGRLTMITLAPGAALPGAHQHPGPVFAYIAKGEIENQVDPDPPKVYRVGDVFYEPPMHAHRLFRNLSQTEPAEVLIFQVAEKGQPVAMAVQEATQPQTPPGMMPYTAILEPQFVPAAEASFLQDYDILIGVARGSVAKAFPAADLAQHGSVNDQMPDGPIEVTWCGVCNTGAVFRAKFKGRTLHFEYDSMVGANEVHKDHETGSRWQQSTGEAISGPLKGSRLELYPFVRTTWKEWRRRYPSTVVLKPLPGYDEKMPNLNKRMRAVTLSGEGDAPKTAFGHDDRLRPKELVAGLRVGTDEKAFPFSELRIARVVNDRVGGVPVLVVHQPSSDTTTAFEARAKGKVLRFQAVDADASSLTDLETHSSWNAYGLCVQGRLKGTQLKTLILMPEFWFAWSEFHPQTKVFTASGASSSEQKR
jgi:quercetin dioxygenase-like cupin family protein